MAFISYAQNFEDVILRRALCDVESGFYVDVGAADPDQHSVTRAFYERGWSGINVEPLDEYFQKLQQARPRDVNLKVALGREAGLRTLHAFAGTGLSTLDPTIGARHKAAGFRGHEIAVPVLTLEKVLEECAPPTVHFLKIDAEGSEKEVLEGMNFDRTRPWIILVEATEPLSAVNSRGPWELLVTSHGYSFAYFDGLNCFYVSDETPGLKERLAVPPNPFDDFVRWPEWLNGQKVTDLQNVLLREQAQNASLGIALEAEKNHCANLQNVQQAERAQNASLGIALEAEKNHCANLQSVLQREQAQNASLGVALVVEKNLCASLQKILQAEQTQNANLGVCLRVEKKFSVDQLNAWGTRLNHLQVSVDHVEAQLASPSIGRALGRVLTRLQEKGNKLTGGGFRALVKRMLTGMLNPCFSFLLRHPLFLRAHAGAQHGEVAGTVAISAAPPSGLEKEPPRSEGSILPTAVVTTDNSCSERNSEPLSVEDPIAATLPASARAIYFQLQTAMPKEAIPFIYDENRLGPSRCSE
jgi:FkbM family methyltransferase